MRVKNDPSVREAPLGGNMTRQMPTSSRLTPATVLKAIRDQAEMSRDELLEMFRNDRHTKYFLPKMLEDLEAAGCISLADGKYAATNQWVRIQATLGISLTSLIEVGRPGALSVTPQFGIPEAVRPVPDVFVLMSFAPEFTPVYKEHITSVATGVGLTVGRADDFFTAHAVMRDVWTAVCRTRVLIADCTGRNPNVFYEIGMAHTVGKPVILITQSESDVPFDLRHIRYIQYSYTPPGMRMFEATLAETIRDVLVDR